MRHKLGMLVLIGTLLATAQAMGGAPSGPEACPPGCCVQMEACDPSACAPCPLPCASGDGAQAMACTE